MSINAIFNRNVNGTKTEIHPKTVIGQVVGLQGALDARPTSDDMNTAIADAKITTDVIKVADTSGQASWSKEDIYWVGNDGDGYEAYHWAWTSAAKTAGAWISIGDPFEVNLADYVKTADVADKPNVFYGSDQPQWANGDYWIEVLA
jgi:hypothetical protein